MLSNRQKKTLNELVSSYARFLLILRNRMEFSEKKQFEVFKLFFSFRKSNNTKDALKGASKSFKKNLGPKSIQTKCLLRLHQELREGKSFRTSNDLPLYFSNNIQLFFMMIENFKHSVAGENSDKKQIDVSMLQTQYEREVSIRRQGRFKGLWAYILIVLGTALFLTSGSILPEMVKAEGIDYYTDNIQTAEFIYQLFKPIWLPLTLFLVALAVVIKVHGLDNWNFPARYKYLDKLPGFVNYKALIAGKVITVLSILRSTGSAPKEALEILDTVVNPYSKKFIQKMKQLVAGGRDKDALVTSELVNSMQRIRLDGVFESSNGGDVSTALAVLAENMADDTIDAIERSSKVSSMVIGLSGAFLLMFGLGNWVTLLTAKINNFV